MKKIIFVLILSVYFCDLKAQVNEYYFYPLKEGNVWVYSLYNTQWGTTAKVRKTVSATQIVNGHKYYKIGEVYIRTDSSNANVYQYYSSGGCPWSANERMIDSLSARLNDTVRNDCGNSVRRCLDTNIRNIFGVNRSSKHFVYMGGGKLYVKDIGLYETYGGSGINLFSETLLGCVLNGVVYGDTSMLTGINQISTQIPEEFELFQNYPNPFNPLTHFGFQIAYFGLVKLTVYNALGEEVVLLVNKQLQPGTYEADWDASAYPSGVYYYKLETINFTETKKMILIK